MDQNELRRLEDLCIQDCPPPCAAACPVHVDVRGVAHALSQGEVAAALQLLRRALPFPGLLGRICERPCEAVCTRGAAGEPIAIAALERACADLGAPAPDKARPARRNRHIAIVGGGLCGATAAYDLVRKGYGVSLYDALDPLGGRLWTYPEEVLPHALITTEFGRLEPMGVVLHLNTRVGADLSLDALRDENEAVLLACGLEAADPFGLECDAAGRPLIDAATYATRRPGVFAAGGLVRGEHSAIGAVMDGRRAAISIDRFVQAVSLTAARAGEGPQTSCLYTDTTHVAPVARVQPADPGAGYTAAEAQAEAARCLQCECLECVKVCEYLAAYGRYPRKYVREVYNNLSIVKGTRYANQFINACSLCGLCAEVCPTDFDMGAVNLAARQEMVAQGRMPPSAHDFALRELAFSQSDHFTLARSAPGTAASDYVFFPGCQLSGSAPEHVAATYAYLTQALPEARVGLWLGCCGAPAEWAGRGDLFTTALAQLRSQHAALGKPRVVLACATCARVWAQHLPEIETASLWDLLAERGLPAGAASGAGQTVSIHDPCAARHATGVQDSVRQIVTQLGYAIAELPRSRERTTCCSYGGAQWLANRQVAHTVVQRRVDEGPDDYVTYCATCRDFLAGHGKRTLHVLDLVFADPAARAARPDPGWSQRRANRAGLKRRMLADVWGEPMETSAVDRGPRLSVSAAVAAKLEERLILLDDVRFVIDQAERTGRKFLRPENEHLLASGRRGAVTFWVEYAPEGEAFVVYGAYSHRMAVADATLPVDPPEAPGHV